MDQNEIDIWALKLTKKISNFWEKIATNNHTIRENGFSVFFSRVYSNPQLLVIGINPGGNFVRDKIKFNEHEIESKLPIIHDYFLSKEMDYDLAKYMRELFSFNLPILKNSVKINYYFFRTTSEDDLKKLEEFPIIHDFCTEQIKNVIETLKPKKIITEGLGVFDKLYNFLNFKDNEIKTILSKNNKNVLIKKCSRDDIELIGVIHPSGQWTKNIFIENKDVIIQELKKSFI